MRCMPADNHRDFNDGGKLNLVLALLSSYKWLVLLLSFLFIFPIRPFNLLFSQCLCCADVNKLEFCIKNKAFFMWYGGYFVNI